jgi:geranylgeranylglycerol-phosphate geranylgeranyltransferase
LRIYSNISVIILGINLLLLILYTRIIKPTVFLGNIVVSYLLGSTFLFCAEIFGNITLGIIPALLAFSFNLARELIKDIEDESGDKQNNIKTLPVRYGIKYSKNLATILILIINIGSFIPYILGIYGKYYLITLIISVEIPLLLVLNLLRISKEKRDFTRISKIMKFLVFFGLLSIYLGKF